MRQDDVGVDVVGGSMLVALINATRDYAWGSRGAISDLLGHPRPLDRPEAELWVGAHAAAPSTLNDPRVPYSHLDTWIAADPLTTTGRTDGTLPFLLKLLAAQQPLSLQVHPTADHARAGFDRENRQRLPLDAATRNYKDPLAKSELIVAISPRFEALSGFRPIKDVIAAVNDLTVVDEHVPGATPDAFAALRASLSGASPFRDTVRLALTAPDNHPITQLPDRLARLATHASDDARLRDTMHVITVLHNAFPGDPGITIAVLMNYIVLAAGEGAFLPAGQLHADLGGLGVELMVASDNVLRGGLTSKHIDVAELLTTTTFESFAAGKLASVHRDGGVQTWTPPIPEFQLHRIQRTESTSAAGAITLHGAGVLLATRGDMRVTGAQDTVRVRKGDSFFATASEHVLRIEGAGEVWIATGNTDPGQRRDVHTSTVAGHESVHA